MPKKRKQDTQHVRSVSSDADNVTSISGLSNVPGTESLVAPTIVPPKTPNNAHLIFVPFLFSTLILKEMRLFRNTALIPK
jgi:hypothetical protein